MTGVRQKWRPSLGLVIALVCAGLVSVPVLAFLALRLSSNQFVRETEQSLIHQAAIYAAVYAEAWQEEGGERLGLPLAPGDKKFWDAALRPSFPVLNLRHSKVLGPLPDETDLAGPLDPRHQAIAPRLQALFAEAGRATLSGAKFLDHQGRDIFPDRRAAFADQSEVRHALAAHVGSALRERGDAYNRHPLTSISRDTWYRVFVAYPVIVDDHVVGVVYLSRTPSNLAKFLVNEWFALGVMLLATLVSAFVLGLLLLRLLLGPVRALSQQAHQVAQGTLPEPRPLAHYGVRELARLGGDVMRMAGALTARGREIRVYTDHVTHELKSPVTAIVGAAELLEEPGLSETDRARLVTNIAQEGARMNTLLERLRELTRLRGAVARGPARLSSMLPEVAGLALNLEQDGDVPLSLEQGRIVLTQLARNAVEHGANRMDVRLTGVVLDITDDGPGISPADASKVTEPFFTTRREQGGTGMGLAIVQTILDHHGAQLSVEPSDTGAHLRIAFNPDTAPRT